MTCGFFNSSCKRGPVRACSLSPSKFKIGVRDKSLTPINSPLILFPLLLLFESSKSFRNHSAFLILCTAQEGGGEIGEISYRNLVY